MFILEFSLQVQNLPDGDIFCVDDYNHAQVILLPQKLPADIELMVHRELWKWIGEEIFREHWLQGENKNCITYGHPDFEPSFWLGDLWPWKEVNKHPKDLQNLHTLGKET